MYIARLIAFFVSFVSLIGCSSHPNKVVTPMKTEMKNSSEKAQAQKVHENKKEEGSSLISLIKCKREKDERTVLIQKMPSGCTVSYTKFNKKEEVASSRYGMDHCESVKGKIVKNLTVAGFTCGQ